MALADDINAKIDDAISTFSANMQTRGLAAWRKVARNIRNMDTDDAGTLVRSSFNTDTVQDIGSVLTESIQSPKMQESLTRMKSKLEPIRVLARDYYIDKFNTEPPQQLDRLAKGLVTSTRNEINDEIGGAGFQQAVVNPAISAMSGHITNNSSLDSAIGDVEHRIKDRIKTFTDIKASTLMQQYGRRINDLYGSALGKKAKYAGPKDDKNRNFCSHRVGKFYTAEEIKSWSVLDWEGKIPNTDRGSIFVNLGGFNCRHILEWEQ